MKDKLTDEILGNFREKFEHSPVCNKLKKDKCICDFKIFEVFLLQVISKVREAKDKEFEKMIGRDEEMYDVIKTDNGERRVEVYPESAIRRGRNKLKAELRQKLSEKKV